MKLSTAIIYSLVAHVLLIGLLAFNYQFSKVEIKQSKASSQIRATSVNARTIEQLVKKIKQKDIDKKNKDLERLRKLKKEEEKVRKKRIEEEQKVKKAKQRQADAEKIRKVEEKKAADAKKKRVADDKARKKKIANDKKKKIADEKKRKAEAERKRKQKEAADKKRKEDAKRKKEAEEKAAFEKELEQQMADEAAALSEIKHQQVLTEVDKYYLLIQNKIKRNWIEPELKGSCVFRIRVAPGGLITNISELSGEKQHCESGRRAINKSEPLPMSSDPDVFEVLKLLTFELENKGENEN